MHHTRLIRFGPVLILAASLVTAWFIIELGNDAYAQEGSDEGTADMALDWGVLACQNLATLVDDVEDIASPCAEAVARVRETCADPDPLLACLASLTTLEGFEAACDGSCPEIVAEIDLLRRTTEATENLRQLYDQSRTYFEVPEPIDESLLSPIGFGLEGTGSQYFLYDYDSGEGTGVGLGAFDGSAFDESVFELLDYDEAEPVPVPFQRVGTE